MRGLLHLGQDVRADITGEEEFQNSDGVAAVGHRGEDPAAICAIPCHDQALVAQDFVVGTAVGQRDRLGAVPRGCTCGVVDPQQPPPDDVDEQE